MDALRRRILSGCRSVHAFCRAHPELKRSTVYMVLSGRYPGNAARQARRIVEALDNQAREDGAARIVSPAVSSAEIFGVLKVSKCGACRQCDSRVCLECMDKTRLEAEALAKHLRAREAS